MRIQVPFFIMTYLSFITCTQVIIWFYCGILSWGLGVKDVSSPIVLKKRRVSEGFTLVELLCVIAIIGILTSIATPLFSTYRDRAMQFQSEVQIRLLEKEITNYFIYNRAYPNSLDDIGFGNLLDIWGNPYQYLRIDGGNSKGKGKFRKDRFLVPINSDYDLYSMGPDGKSVSPLTAKASRDDIIRANDGAYFGPASLY